MLSPGPVSCLMGRGETSLNSGYGPRDFFAKHQDHNTGVIASYKEYTRFFFIMCQKLLNFQSSN